SNSTEFRAMGGTCAGTLAPHGSCSINYHFRPTAADTGFTASTAIGAGATGVGYTDQPLHFAGRGTETLLQLSPLSVDFGAQQIGSVVEVLVIATNTHDETVTFAGGGLMPPFAAFTSCSGGVAPGAACSHTWRFTPATTQDAQDST